MNSEIGHVKIDRLFVNVKIEQSDFPVDKQTRCPRQNRVPGRIKEGSDRRGLNYQSYKGPYNFIILQILKKFFVKISFKNYYVSTFL